MILKATGLLPEPGTTGKQRTHVLQNGPDGAFTVEGMLVPTLVDHNRDEIVELKISSSARGTVCVPSNASAVAPIRYAKKFFSHIDDDSLPPASSPSRGRHD